MKQGQQPYMYMYTITTTCMYICTCNTYKNFKEEPGIFEHQRFGQGMNNNPLQHHLFVEELKVGENEVLEMSRTHYHTVYIAHVPGIGRESLRMKQPFNLPV